MEKERYEQILKAIEGSIIKWEMIDNLTGVDTGPKNCPLCKMFEGSCHSCPIKKITDEAGCRETPCADFEKHWAQEHGPYIVNTDRYIVCPECERLVQAEIKFLNRVKDEFIRNQQANKKYFWTIAFPKRPVGEPNVLTITDENGDEAPSTAILGMRIDGIIERYPFVNSDVGLLLDKSNRVVISDI